MDRVVLFSGGMDSTVSLVHTLRKLQCVEKPGRVRALTFDYGQKHKAEIDAATAIWQMLFHTPYEHYMASHVVVPIDSNIMPRVGTLLSGEPNRIYMEDSPPSTEIDPSFIPYRNLLFLTIAAMWARQWRCREVISGLRGGFPDCTPEFEEKVTECLTLADPEFSICCTSPTHISRAASIELIKNVPYGLEALSLSLTCFEGTEPPCGVCLPCTKRAEGFAQAGIPDPLLERLNA